MRARAAVSAGLVLLVSAVVTGCGLLVPQATLKQYAPSDGVDATIGSVELRNVLAIAGSTIQTTGTANLVLTAINTSGSTVTLHVQYASGSTRKDLSLPLDPGSNTIGYGASTQTLLTGFETSPGSLASIYFQYGSQEGVQLKVPVLDNSWSSYSTLGPTPTPSASRTATPSVTGSATPTPSASATP